AGAEIVYRPIYLRVFPAFTNGLPYDMPRLQYIITDLQRCCVHWKVPIDFPSEFPINGLTALRIALFAQAHAPEKFAAVHQALFRAAWRDQVEISKKEIALEVGARAGLDPAALKAGIEAAEIKEKLRAQTAEAIERGAFGAPTFFLGDELYFGHDR